jgi:hypothetical protein
VAYMRSGPRLVRVRFPGELVCQVFRSKAVIGKRAVDLSHDGQVLVGHSSATLASPLDRARGIVSYKAATCPHARENPAGPSLTVSSPNPVSAW